MSIRAEDARLLGREGDALFQISDAKGSWVYDDRGRPYVDFLMGSCVGNLGWGNDEIRAAIRNARGPEYVSPMFHFRPWVELARLLVEIAPGRMRRCWRATGGSEAVELALQAAMIATGRRKFVSIEGSYHGNTIGALSIGASENRETYTNLLPGCAKIEPPLDARAADRLETALKRRDVAAFIMEPVVIALGVEVPDPEFMRRARDLCTRYGTLFVADEVATGFGRTGRLFACQHFNLEPDILCIAKALSSGMGGLGATLMTEKVARALGDDFSFYSTYGWHPFAVQAALATLRIWKRDGREILENASEASRYFAKRLGAMELGERRVRVKGLAIGVDLGDEKIAERVEKRSRELGVLVEQSESWIKLLPALTIDRRVAEKGLDLFEQAVWEAKPGRRRAVARGVDPRSAIRD